MRARDTTGLIGVVFAFVDVSNHFRSVLRLSDGCWVVEQRSDNSTYSVLAQGSMAASSLPVLGASFDMRVIYGNNSITALLIDTPTQRTLSSVRLATAGVDFAGHVGVFSSHNPNGAQFVSLFVVDASVESDIVASTTSPATPTSVGVTPAPQPVDCVLSDWSAWSACSETCHATAVGGVQTATRAVLVPASNGGAACGNTTQVIGCNIDVSCAPPCNCVGCNLINLVGSYARCGDCCVVAHALCCAQSGVVSLL
jgi:hypothetical protein